MHNRSLHRVLVLLTSLLILVGMLHAQIIIKDTIQIKPKHLSTHGTATVTQPIRFELSWNGGLNGWVDVYLYEPCGGGDDYKGRWETNSQLLSFTAVGPQAGKYTVIANFFGAQSGITNLKLRVFDEGLPAKEIPFPIGSNSVEYNTPYYSGFRFYDNSNGRDEDIVYEEFAGMLLVNEYNCSGTRWMPFGNPLITYTITQGSEYASLAEYFSRTIYGNAYTASYQDGPPIVVANGVRPADTDGALVEVTAQSGDVIATRRFRVRPYDYRITPESLTIPAGEQTMIGLDLIDWRGVSHNRGVAAATELIFEDTSDIGTLVYETEDGEILQRSDTLVNIDVPPSPYLRGRVKFIGSQTAVADTLVVKIKAKKSGEGNWIWIQRPRQAPYEGATATTGEGELRIVPNVQQLCPVVSISPAAIQAGETAAITVRQKTADGTLIDYPAGTLFDVFMQDADTQFGDIKDNEGRMGSSLKNVTVPITFIASGDIFNQVTIPITGQPSEGVAGSCGIPSANLVIEDGCNSVLPAAPRCSGVTNDPAITVTAQPNGFGGVTSDACKDGYTKGFFVPMPATNTSAMNIPTIDVCYDESARKWKVSVPSITINTILDLCDNNVTGFGKTLVWDLASLPKDEICGNAKLEKDLLGHYSYPIANDLRYYFGSVLMLHEDYHKQKYGAELIAQFGDKINKLNDNVIPCRTAQSVEEAREAAVKNIAKSLSGILTAMTQHWNTLNGYSKDGKTLIDKTKNEAMEQANHQKTHFFIDDLKEQLKSLKATYGCQ